MPRVTGERFGEVVKFPIGTVFSKELVDKISSGDKVYTRLDEVVNSDYANPEEPIILKYETIVHDDSGHTIFNNKEIDMLWFRYDVPDSIIPMNKS